MSADRKYSSSLTQAPAQNIAVSIIKCSEIDRFFDVTSVSFLVIKVNLTKSYKTNGHVITV